MSWSNIKSDLNKGGNFAVKSNFDLTKSNSKKNDTGSNSNTPNTGSNFSIESGSTKNVVPGRMKLSTNSRVYDKDKGRVSNNFVLFHTDDIDNFANPNQNYESGSEDNRHMEHLVSHVIDHPESPNHQEEKKLFHENYK